MIQIAVCDDEKVIASQIENILLEVCEEEGIPADVDIFYSGEELEKELSKGTRYDLFYLDIQMKCESGITAAEHIRKTDKSAVFIFVSGYAQYAMELYRLDVFAFVKKPVQKTAFRDIFLEANQKICDKKCYFTFRYRNREYKVPCMEILYFESRARKIIVCLQSGETEIFNGKLSDVETSLSKGKVPFLRIHQSYLVNYHFIRARSRTEVMLVNGLKLPISEERQKEFGRTYRKMLGRDIGA